MRDGEIDLGDLKAVYRPDGLGVDIVHKTDGKALCFFNEKGASELAIFIREHYGPVGDDPSYLMIVRKAENTDQWVVDEDSQHLLTDDGGNYPVQELTISKIRAVSCGHEEPTEGCNLCGQ